jgi:tetratricopeptide (TPR) repeat protein
MTSIVNILAVFDKGNPITLALAALERGELATAETALTALIDAPAQREPQELALIFNKRGVARVRLERRDEARADFEAALAVLPRYAPALANIGNLHFEAGDVPTAIAQFEAAIAADPDYAIAYFNLGAAYKRAGRFVESVRALRRGRQLEDRAAPSAWRWRRRP